MQSVILLKYVLVPVPDLVHNASCALRHLLDAVNNISAYPKDSKFGADFLPKPTYLLQMYLEAVYVSSADLIRYLDLHLVLIQYILEYLLGWIHLLIL